MEIRGASSAIEYCLAITHEAQRHFQHSLHQIVDSGLRAVRKPKSSSKDKERLTEKT